MLDRDDSPWYPTMRLFRQSSPADWGGVFERIGKGLAQERLGGASVLRATVAMP